MMHQWGYGQGTAGKPRWFNGSGYGAIPGGPAPYAPRMMAKPGWFAPDSAALAPMSVDAARSAAQKYVDALDLTGLELGEVMIFENHAYVIVEEATTGIGAFELLVDPATKLAYPEHGPNMMWNLKYGAINHSGMMGRGGMMGMWRFQKTAPAEVSPEMPVSVSEAREAAQAYLDEFVSGAQASSTPAPFYGYYTFDFEQDGSVAGMLSVNGFNGQVFLHTWHGSFIEEAD